MIASLPVFLSLDVHAVSTPSLPGARIPPHALSTSCCQDELIGVQVSYQNNEREAKQPGQSTVTKEEVCPHTRKSIGCAVGGMGVC